VPPNFITMRVLPAALAIGQYPGMLSNGATPVAGRTARIHTQSGRL